MRKLEVQPGLRLGYRSQYCTVLEDGQVIAEFFDRSGDQDDVKNAKLFAAAPEMLEALKNVLRPCDHSDTLRTCPKCRGAIEKLIRKAEEK